jgi:hypothetical protein
MSTTGRHSSLDCQQGNFGLLCPSDRQEYDRLRDNFHEDIGKSRKGERLDVFTDRLNQVRAFIERNDEDQWKRSLVCGVFFLRDSLALNIQQLRTLLGKCKSSINGSLQRLGYSALLPGHEAEQEFLSRIPSHCQEPSDLKRWTIRKVASIVSTPKAPPAPALVIPLPLSWRDRVNVETEAVQEIVRRTFPCPVKCRYKYLDIIHRSVSIQTEI